MKVFEAKMGEAAKAKGGDLTIPEIKKIAVDSTRETTKIPVKTPPKLQIEAPKIQLPGEGILKSQELLRTEAPEVTTPVKSPLIKEAETYYSKADYLKAKGVENWKNTKDAIEVKNQKKTFDDIWEEAHTYEEVKIQPTKDSPVTTKKVSIPRPETPEQAKIIQEIKKEIEPPKTEFESRTREAREEVISKIPEDDIIKIANGDLPSPNNIPSTAYLTYISKKATELRLKGDVTLANKLAESSQGRFAAQALEAMKGEDLYVKTVREIKNSYLDKLPKPQQLQREKIIKSVEEGVYRLYEEINKIKPTRSARLKFLRDNIC
jgi:hypothetical protein